MKVQCEKLLTVFFHYVARSLPSQFAVLFGVAVSGQSKLFDQMR